MKLLIGFLLVFVCSSCATVIDPIMPTEPPLTFEESEPHGPLSPVIIKGEVEPWLSSEVFGSVEYDYPEGVTGGGEALVFLKEASVLEPGTEARLVYGRLKKGDKIDRWQVFMIRPKGE